MTHVLVRHKVEDFNKWKKAFDDFADFRRSSGEKSYQVMQQDKDTNNLFLVFEWDSEANARKFFESQNLKETMQEAGVAEAPDINFVTEADHGRL
jgi:quinol monooxygenase YgiN